MEDNKRSSKFRNEVYNNEPLRTPWVRWQDKCGNIQRGFKIRRKVICHKILGEQILWLVDSCYRRPLAFEGSLSSVVGSARVSGGRAVVLGVSWLAALPLGRSLWLRIQLSWFCDRRSIGLSVLVSGTSLGTWPNFSFLYFAGQLLYSSSYGAPSLTRGRVCNLKCNLSVVRVSENL
jgi:hypothetical protein